MRQLAAMYGYEVNRSGMMRCPFHGEDKHPSLKVYDGERGWYCFVCNEGGDIFDFAMKHDGLEFPTAVERIADMAGIPVSDGKNGLSEEDKARIRRRKEEREAAERAKEERNQRMIEISERIRILEAIRARCEPLSYVWSGAEENLIKLQKEWEYLFQEQEY
jgi:DNA primase